LSRPQGVVVNDLHPRSPAAEAGLETGDVILSVGGFPVADEQALRYRVVTNRVGERLDLTYFRNGRQRTATVKLIEPPEDPPRNLTTLEGRHPFDGAQVANLSPAFNEENGLPTTARGVVVTRVFRRGYAAEVRLRPGDIVLELNGARIDVVDDLEDVLAEGGPFWDLTILRGNREVSGEFRI
jgi:serine protease Do